MTLSLLLNRIPAGFIVLLSPLQRCRILAMCFSSCCSVSWKRKASSSAMAEQPQSKPKLEAQPQAAPIYHERQRLQLCLLHTLNNLYQNETFTRCELNNIACSLPSELQYGGPFSRLISIHYNIITGNYDANVLMRALQSQGADMSFCNESMGIDLDDPKLIGFIFNHETQRFGVWKGRHWAALKKINGAWVDLDSDLAGPVTIGDNDAVRQFISQRFELGSKVIRVWSIV